MNERDYIQFMIRSVRNVLDETGLQYVTNEDSIILGMRTEELIYSVSILFDRFGILIYCNRNDELPNDQFDRVLRYISSLNWWIRFGNFELDMQQRFFRFKLYVALSAEDARDDFNLRNTIDRCLQIAFGTMNVFNRGVSEIINNPACDATEVANRYIHAVEQG